MFILVCLYLRPIRVNTKAKAWVYFSMNIVAGKYIAKPRISCEMHINEVKGNLSYNFFLLL